MTIQEFQATKWGANMLAIYSDKIYPVRRWRCDEHLVGLETVKGEVTWVRCENITLYPVSKIPEIIDNLNGKLTSLLAVCHEEGWNGVENSKCADTFLRTRFEELRAAVAVVAEERDRALNEMNKPRVCDTDEITRLRAELASEIRDRRVTRGISLANTDEITRLRAELASMTEMRDRVVTQSQVTVNDLRRKYDQAFAELAAYRDGGVTEEILRRNDGFIKIGKDCRIVALKHEEQDRAASQGEISLANTNEINRLRAELAALKHEEQEAIEGRCIEAGDDDNGQPRLVIHTTREKLMTFGRNLAFEDVRVTLATPAK